MPEKLNSLDLCTGIGGIALGLEDYAKPLAYCEIADYPRKVLRARIDDGYLPKAPIFPDVNTPPLELFDGEIDIICAGFPCQDISIAGKGKGLEGERSSLGLKICELAFKARSPFIFLENVPAIRKRGLRVIVERLSGAGYDCRWHIVSAASIGAPHLRERFFLLAYSHGLGRQRLSKAWRKISTIPRFNGNKKSLAKKNEAYKIWPDYWSTQPAVSRVAYGLSNRIHRNKCLGNAVVPMQAKLAFEILMGIKC